MTKLIAQNPTSMTDLKTFAPVTGSDWTRYNGTTDEQAYYKLGTFSNGMRLGIRPIFGFGKLAAGQYTASLHLRLRLDMEDPESNMSLHDVSACDLLLHPFDKISDVRMSCVVKAVTINIPASKSADTVNNLMNLISGRATLNTLVEGLLKNITFTSNEMVYTENLSHKDVGNVIIAEFKAYLKSSFLDHGYLAQFANNIEVDDDLLSKTLLLKTGTEGKQVADSNGDFKA